MKKPGYVYKAIAVLALLCILPACNRIENETNSASMLIVETLTGLDAEGEQAGFVQSDVLYVDPNTGEQSIRADVAEVTFRARLLAPTSVTGPSSFNDITVNRYVVTYLRSDGKNIEGVDIPYSFDGSFQVNVEVDATATVPFVIVREVAKAEIPLINLREARDDGVLQVHARVDFYGHDISNRNVTATGYISIFFANYAND